MEEARHKAEVKVASLEVERTSLMLEVGVTKQEQKCLIFNLRRARTKQPWRRTIRRP